MDLVFRIFLVVAVTRKYGQGQDITLQQLPSVNVTEGDSFTLWCNVTNHLTSPQGYQVSWAKINYADNPWCSGVAFANEKPRRLACKRNDASFFNVSDNLAIALYIPSATIEEHGDYTCTYGLIGGNISRSLNVTKVFVEEIVQTTTVPTDTTLGTTETPERKTTTTATATITQNTTKSPSAKATKSPSSPGLPKETIIAIGAAGGGLVLLVTIIVAVVCVKKKSKGNSTSDVNERKSNYRKSNSFEKNAENIYTGDKRKSNPLDKNVENLHYADLTLHENPKSSSSKGTGSAKSTTLTVNPSDDRVEYAAVMTS